MKNVVVIGGGHGQSTIVRGVKNIKDIDLKAIVTVADDGGSTGRLRELYNIPAVGDIRNVLLAMSDNEEFFTKLLDYRFEGENDIDVVGHSLGNLIMVALMGMNDGSLVEAIKQVGRLLNVKGKVFPASLEILTLYARNIDDTITRGEANIPKAQNRISEVYYDHDVEADRDAVDAIMAADLVIYGIGSLYTSIAPIPIIREIGEALNNTKAKRVYFANCMTQQGETYNYDLKDHIDALRKHGAKVDLVVKHNDVIPQSILYRYYAEDAIEVVNNGGIDIPVLERNLLDFSNNMVRHDPEKIKTVVEELLEDC
ncbi:MAG: uridine diphosphate-N-acetylglucosamine-binding protein YvcK [Erysipelotrichaceae bacterium]|nr:uridine diphosphate-N-acetylglucosamine-binding protein YvcK [Erysipelotrichaceae bacterium]